ncbi:MAG: DUF1801 domain-containing protein [Bacteroidota bacterium]
MNLKIKTDPRVQAKLAQYPEHIRVKLNELRSLIIETARTIETISVLEETLKWGEPSYLVKNGSTIRMDWKEKHPEQYAMYFKCTSKLVPTFKALFGPTFQYENNRALIFGIDDSVPSEALKTCIELALTYHQVKHLPKLGK